MSALNETVSASPLDNFGTAGVVISGAWSGTISFEGSINNIDFVPIFVQEISGTKLTSSTIANGQFLVNTSGMFAIRVKMTAFTSGTADIVMQANATPFIQRSLSTIAGDTDGVLIGNVGDRLKVTALNDPENPEEGINVKPTQSHQVDFNKMVCLLDEIIRQLRILNTHMECVTDLENLEEEPGDHPIV